jgi:hypothetical protein
MTCPETLDKFDEIRDLYDQMSLSEARLNKECNADCNLSILLIDDESMNLMVMTSILKRLQF